MLHSLRRRALNIVWLILLAGCSHSSSSGEETVTVDRSALEFASLAGALPPVQYVHFSLANGSGTYYGALDADRPGLFVAGFSFTGPSTATASLLPNNPPPGRMTGSLSFKLCRDEACKTVVWSQIMPYTITVFAVEGRLSFTGTEGSTAPAQSIAISPADDDHLLTATIGAESPWLSVARVGSSLEVTASAQLLLAGTYESNILVALHTGMRSVSIPVSFKVGEGIVTPESAVLVLDIGPPSTRSMPVAFLGGIGPAWTATVNKPWLALKQPSGQGAGAVEYTVDPGLASSVANWTSDVATIVIASPGMTSVSASVTLRKQLPEIYSVSPAAVAPGQPATVSFFGRGLGQLSGAASIDVSHANVASMRAVSDVQVAVDLPALPPGRFTVSVPNAHGIATSSADLTAATPTPWLAASVAHAGEKRSAFYDPARKAVFAVNRNQNSVIRYRLTNGTWEVDAGPVAYIGDIGLSADHRTIYASSGNVLDARLLTVDPETLAVGATTYQFPDSLGPSSIMTDRKRTPGLVVTNNGRVWFGSSSWTKPVYFDPLRASFAAHSGPSDVVSTSLLSPLYFVSSDGSRLIVAAAVGPTFVYTAADDRFASSRGAPRIYGSAALSRDGRWAVIDERNLYDTDTWLLKGSVQVAGTAVGAELSPDGSRLYVPVMTASSDDIERIDVLDTTSLVPGTTSFPKLGEIPVASQASSCASSASIDCSHFPLFIASPLGDALFLVGNQNMVVVPIPDQFAGIR